MVGAVYLLALGPLHGRAGVCACAGCASVLSQDPLHRGKRCLPRRVWALAQTRLPCTAAQTLELMACAGCRCKVRCRWVQGFARRIEEGAGASLGGEGSLGSW